MLVFTLLTQCYCIVMFDCGLGTTSSSNTVLAGQESFSDTDEAKAARENEDRWALLPTFASPFTTV